MNDMGDELNIARLKPWDEGCPSINGPDICGASAGKPFFYAVPATGQRPMEFEAEGLPEGLSIKASSGYVEGSALKEGEFDILLRAKNVHGKAEREFRVSIGRGPALTPPMGWNSWNAWRMWVDDSKIRQAADALTGKGLAARGYTFVNIDSCWQGPRGGRLNSIQPNSKFPDMKSLSDYVHSRGLKIGIYSSPWTAPFGCHKGDPSRFWGGPDLIGCSSGDPDPDYPFKAGEGMYIGINKHEACDVAQWVEWEMDYLKYDWTPNDPVSLERMGRLLKESSRDFIMSICLEARIENAVAYKRWAHMWRGIPDTRDNWPSVVKNAFLSDDWFNEDWRPYSGPGGWHDLDMLALGPQYETKDKSRPNRLTKSEQVACMTAWALYPSPILLSCDLEAADDFEMSLFGNEEVIAINQDRLGRPAYRLKEERFQPVSSGRPVRNSRVWAKELADGSFALGLFNLSDRTSEISVDLRELGIDGSLRARNVWEKRDLERTGHVFSLQVEPHGAQLVKITV